MAKTAYKRCKKLRTKLEKTGKLHVIEGTKKRGILRAQLDQEVEFTVVTGGLFDDPLFEIWFLAASIGKYCRFKVHKGVEPDDPMVGIVGQHRAAQKDLDKLLGQLGV